jgi:uncharacterized protein (TIGR00288 family)
MTYGQAMDPQLRIALLIDADNVTRGNVEQVIVALRKLGDATIKRAYGNWFDARLKRWEPVLRAEVIRPIQQFNYTKGKNATDMALVIDAITLLHSDRPDAFAIVSSDADFTPLVTHLREHGLPVYGYGRADTPAPFRSACSAFEVFDDGKPAPTGAAKSNGKRTVDDELLQRLSEAVQKASGKEGWARIQAVRAALGPRDSFSPNDYGHSNLSKLLKATNAFELRNEGSPAVQVRVKGRSGTSGSRPSRTES